MTGETVHFVTGIVGVLGTALLIIQMNVAWPMIHNTAQRMRYICLLLFAMTGAYASAVDITFGRPLRSDDIALTGACMWLVITAMVSIRQSTIDRRTMT